MQNHRRYGYCGSLRAPIARPTGNWSPDTSLGDDTLRAATLDGRSLYTSNEPELRGRGYAAARMVICPYRYFHNCAISSAERPELPFP